MITNYQLATPSWSKTVLLKAISPFSSIEASLYFEAEFKDTRSTVMRNCSGVTVLITTQFSVPAFLTDSSYPITDVGSAGALQLK